MPLQDKAFPCMKYVSHACMYHAFIIAWTRRMFHAWIRRMIFFKGLGSKIWTGKIFFHSECLQTCSQNWINFFTYQNTRCLDINDKCPVSSVQCPKWINSILTARGRAGGAGLIFPYHNVSPRGAKNSGNNKNFSKYESLSTCKISKSEKSCYHQIF